jgi:PRC-barrel domain
MSILKAQSVLCAAAIVFLATLSAASQSPAPPAPAEEKPPATAPAQEPGPSPQRPHAAPPSETPAGQMGQDLVGLSVFSSDGSKVGDVRAVNTGPSGNIATLHVRTGGFLGFGGRLVAIPEGSFAKKGPDIRLTLTAEQVSNLPAVKEAK